MNTYKKILAKQPVQLLCIFCLLTNVGYAKTHATATEINPTSDHKTNHNLSQLYYKHIYSNMSAVPATEACVEKSKTSLICGKDMVMDFKLLKEADLDGNGTTDLLVKSVTSGINYNYYASELHMILLDDNAQYQNHHSLLMSARGAHQTLDIKKVTQTPKGTHISAIAKLNDKNLDGVMDNSDAHLTFMWKNGKLYEESYLNKCKLANMANKRIFNDAVNNVQRYVTLDSLDYTQKQEEATTYGGNRYRAVLHGCDNLQVSFNVTGKQASVQKVLTDLAKISRFKSVFNTEEIQAFKQQANPEKESVMYYGSWLVRVMHDDITFGTTKQKTVTIKLVKRSGPQDSESGSHWNVALRLK